MIKLIIRLASSREGRSLQPFLDSQTKTFVPEAAANTPGEGSAK